MNSSQVLERIVEENHLQRGRASLVIIFVDLKINFVENSLIQGGVEIIVRPKNEVIFWENVSKQCGIKLLLYLVSSK